MIGLLVSVLTVGCIAGAPGGGEYEPITLHVDNLTSRVVEIDRRISSSLGRRLGLVNGQSKRTFEVPYNPTFSLAHELLTSPGYQVEHCRGDGPRACTVTRALHLPSGAEVMLVIDQRNGNRLYYREPGREGE